MDYFFPYFIPGQISLNMEVNSTVDFLSNCISLSGSNCSGDPFYECMDSYPGNVFTGFYIVTFHGNVSSNVSYLSLCLFSVIL